MSQIYSYRKGDEKDIVDLLKKSFSEWKEQTDPLNYWKWKWLESPNGYNIIYTLIDDRIVAVTHIMYLYIKVGEKVLKTSYSDDLATHPDYRGRGLYIQLREVIDAEEPKKGIKIIYSVNSHPATIHSNLKRDRITLPYSIENLFLIKKPYLHFKMIKSKNKLIYSVGYIVLRLKNKIVNIFNMINNRQIPTMKIVQSDEFSEEYDIFWDKIKNYYKFIMVRDSIFLNWRYSKNGGNFINYEIFDDNELVGFSVIEIKTKEEYNTGYICELLSLNNDENVIKKLVDHIKTEAKKLDLNYISFKTTNIKTIILLEKLGFVKMPFKKEFQAMYKFEKSKQEKELLLNAKNEEIYWSYGDYFP